MPKINLDSINKKIISDGPSSLQDHGIFLLMGEIEEGVIQDAIEFILEANLDPECDLDYLTLIINSPGGIVSDGFALIDIMNGSRIPIRTIGLGMIASMGLSIFLTGERGTRTLTPNTMILSHQYSGISWGKEHELIASRTEYNITSEMVIRHYCRTTGLSEKQVKEKLLPPSDVWITAQQAKKLGVCDIIKDLKPQSLQKRKKK